MEIKVQNKNTTNYGITSHNTKKNNETSFADTLNSVLNGVKSEQTLVVDTDTNNTKDNTYKQYREAGMARIESLPEKNKAIVKKLMFKDIEQATGLDPCNYFNENGTLNVRRFLEDYGHTTKSYNLDFVSKAFNTLYDNGLIETEDYYYALKWIASAAQGFKVSAGAEQKINSIFQSIGSHQKKDN